MKPTRADRFREIRDELLSHTHGMQPSGGSLELLCGPFRILLSPPGLWGPGRGWNLQIWPGGIVGAGHVVQADKVANVDWNQSDEIEMLSYRSGAWEADLLQLLRSIDTVAPFGKRRLTSVAPGL